MKFVTRTHRGNILQNNQDSFLNVQDVTSLHAVADGMGGHLGGNVASAMAIEALKTIDLKSQPNEQALLKAVDLANRSIWERQINDPSLSGMGTTLTLLWEGRDTLFLAHVGDSRAYHFKNGKLEQVTSDHSLVAELLRSGIITPEKARNYPYRNVITRAVGTNINLRADIMRFPRLSGSRWLLCSDGLTEYAQAEQIIFAMALPLEEAADHLLQVALHGGGRDNITLTMLEVLK